MCVCVCVCGGGGGGSGIFKAEKSRLIIFFITLSTIDNQLTTILTTSLMQSDVNSKQNVLNQGYLILDRLREYLNTVDWSYKT